MPRPFPSGERTPVGAEPPTRGRSLRKTPAAGFLLPVGWPCLTLAGVKGVPVLIFLVQGSRMKTSKVFLLLLAGGLLVRPAAAAEGPKTGGNFEVEVIKGVAYYDGKDADPVRHKLDLYLPKGQKDYPVLFFIHGGAWRAGSKDGFGRLGRVFARNGVGVVAINYRLSPAVKHPAHIQDVARAFAWT